MAAQNFVLNQIDSWHSIYNIILKGLIQKTCLYIKTTFIVLCIFNNDGNFINCFDGNRIGIFLSFKQNLTMFYHNFYSNNKCAMICEVEKSVLSTTLLLGQQNDNNKKCI